MFCAVSSMAVVLYQLKSIFLFRFSALVAFLSFAEMLSF